MITRFTSKSELLRGGEKMKKTWGFVLALLVVCCGAIQADTGTIDVYEGWNYIACPLVPFDPTPYQVLGGETGPLLDDLLLGRLNRYDAVTGGTPTYITDETFGNMLLGDGYQLLATPNTAVTYEGVADGVPSGGVMTDMWISLPGFKEPTGNLDAGGWHLIGNPFQHDVPTYHIVGEAAVWRVWFTDGIEMKNWFDAVDAFWVSDTFLGYSNGLSSQVTFLDPDNYTLKTARGYWIETKRDNLAMIIIAAAPAGI